MVGRWLASTGNVYLQGDIATLAPRIQGHVAAILVADNQRVAAGDALIELDPGLRRARLAEAETTAAWRRCASSLPNSAPRSATLRSRPSRPAPSKPAP